MLFGFQNEFLKTQELEKIGIGLMKKYEGFPEMWKGPAENINRHHEWKQLFTCSSEVTGGYNVLESKTDGIKQIWFDY